MESLAFDLPGVTVGFPENTAGLFLDLQDLEQAEPWVGELLALAQVGPTLKDSRKTWGKPPKKDSRFDPAAGDFRSVDPDREVLAILPAYGARAWITYKANDPTTVASISFESTGDAGSACSDAVYPTVRVEQSRWEPVKRAFEDPSALPMLMSLHALDITAWIDLVQNWGFAHDPRDNLVYGHGLAFRTFDTIDRIQVDRTDDWLDQVLSWPPLPSWECPERWTGYDGELVLRAREGERDWEGAPEQWFEIRNDRGRLDPTRTLAEHLTAPHCERGDCDNGAGRFYWNDGCSFEGSFAAGVPEDGKLLLGEADFRYVVSPEAYALLLAEQAEKEQARTNREAALRALNEASLAEYHRRVAAGEIEPINPLDLIETDPYVPTPSDTPPTNDEPTDNGSRGPWVCTFEHGIFGMEQRIEREVMVEEYNGWLTLSGSWYEPGLEGNPTVYFSFTSDLEGNQREGMWHTSELTGELRMVQCLE